MSTKDADILKKCGISIDNAQDALGLTRQAVTKGIAQEKDYFGDYAGFARLVKILEYLKNNNLSGAERLEKEIWENHKELVASLEKHQDQLRFFSWEPQNTDFEELWVFSMKPLEVQETSYLDKMADKYLCHSKYTIAYFCPHDSAKHLSSKFLHRMLGLIESKNCKINELAEVYVFECSATLVSPHFAIYDPRTTEPRGGVLVSNDRFAALHKEICSKIVEEVLSAGLGILKDSFVPSYKGKDSIYISGGGINFNMIFSSKNIVSE